VLVCTCCRPHIIYTCAWVDFVQISSCCTLKYRPNFNLVSREIMGRHAPSRASCSALIALTTVIYPCRLVFPIDGLSEGEPLLMELFDKDFNSKEFLGQVGGAGPQDQADPQW